MRAMKLAHALEAHPSELLASAEAIADKCD